QAVRPGDRWTATPASIQELTDLERIESGNVECRLEQLTTEFGHRVARISLKGTVRGTNEDGPNQQSLDGYFYFDLQSHSISYLTLKGISSLLDKDGKAMGRIEGLFVMTRQAPAQSDQLGDAAIRGLATEPNADN